MRRISSVLLFTALAPALLASCAVPPPAASRRPSSIARDLARLPPFEAAVVGTIHKAHLLQRDYPLAVLGEILEAYQPDLVLVEIRPRPFAQSRFEDGPFEMTYVTQLARERRITVVPIDRWSRRDLTRKPPRVHPADRAALHAVVAPLMSAFRWPPTFADVHSARFTRAYLHALTARARFEAGNATWNARQAWFHAQATDAILLYRPRRVLAFVGAEHRPELVSHLWQLGAELSDPVRLLGQRRVVPSDLAGRAAPADVVALWQAGVERLRAQAPMARGPMRRALREKLRYFEVAVEQKGRCCVTPGALVPPPDQEPPPVDAPRPGVAPPAKRSAPPAPATPATPATPAPPATPPAP